MKIDLDRFLALTAVLAAPLVSASGCIVVGTGNDDANGTDDGASADGSDPTGSPSTSASTDGSATGDGTDTGTDSGLDTGSEGTDSDGTGESADTTAGVDTTGGNELGNCCEVHAEAGCEFAEVSDCVCAEDPFCCETEWDMNCVNEVNSFGCGACELPPQVWDCYCVASCDGAPVDTPWQVCSDSEVDAAQMGTASCEAELGGACETFACDDCSCFTAEFPEIECS